MNKINPVLLVIAGAVLFLQASIQVFAKTEEEVINKAYLTTEFIQVVVDGKLQGACSGTAVAESTILTATHCLPRKDVIGLNGQIVKVVKIIDDGVDGAFVIVEGVKFDRVSKVKLGSPRIGAPVFIIGNPGRYNRLYRAGTMAGETSAISGGRATKINMYNLNSFPGDSGSGIFNEKGEIVGVVNVLITQELPQVRWHMTGSASISFTRAQFKEAGVKL